MMRRLLVGAAAGAAGTTALNAATYLDMTLRGRPASETPTQTMEKLAERSNITVPGDQDQRANRLSAAGALAGLGTGVAVGGAYGLINTFGLRPSLGPGALLATVLAMAGSNIPMTKLGVADPSTWTAADWLSDVVPHLAYGLVTAIVFNAAA